VHFYSTRKVLKLEEVIVLKHKKQYTTNQSQFKRGGVYVTIGGPGPKWLRSVVMLFDPLFSKIGLGHQSL